MSDEGSTGTDGGTRDYAIFTADPKGLIEGWSRGAEVVFGWTPDEIIGQPFDVTFTPEDRANNAPELELGTARAEGSAPDVRWHLRGDGSRVFIEGVTRALYGPDGAVRGFLKIGQDVTHRLAIEQALQASEERFRTLVQNVHDYAIFLLDAEGLITAWPEGAERVKGYGADEAIGRHVSMFHTPEQIAAGEVEEELAEASLHGRAEREGWRVRKDGRRIWVHSIVTAVRDADGRLTGFTGISRDQTQHRAAQRALHESQDRLRLTLEAADLGIWEYDATTHLFRLDARAQQLYDLPATVTLEEVDERIHPDDRQTLQTQYVTAMDPAQRAPIATEYRIVDRDGTVRWVRVVGRAYFDGDGADAAPQRALGTAQDVTDEKRSHEALLESEARLRELNQELEERVRERTAALAEANLELTAQIEHRMAAEEARSQVLHQLVTAEENERRRISRELHDSLGQLVTGLMLGLRSLGRRPVEERARIDELEQLADRIAREMQHLAVELRPPALDNLGLVPALRNQLDEFSERARIPVDFHAAGLERDRLPPQVETTVYRIVQEGLTNILKHASAKHVSLLVERRGAIVRAILEDDGSGFDYDAVLASPEKATRLGIRGMRERVALIGGELEIETGEGSGTSIFLRLPVAGDAASSAG